MAQLPKKLVILIGPMAPMRQNENADRRREPEHVKDHLFTGAL